MNKHGGMPTDGAALRGDSKIRKHHSMSR